MNIVARFRSAVEQFCCPKIHIRQTWHTSYPVLPIDYHHYSILILDRLGIDPTGGGSMIRVHRDGKDAWYLPYEYVTYGFEQLWPDIWVHRVIKTLTNRIKNWRYRFFAPGFLIRANDDQYRRIVAQLKLIPGYRWEIHE